MKLSVIIPCLNAEATLATQLEALAAQQWSEPWELVISDNGSTDKSLKIAEQYRGRFPAFQIINSSGRKRQSHALNVGVCAAIAHNLAFCDADDEVAQGWVASMGDGLCSHEIVYGQFRFDKFNDSRTAEHMAEQWKDGLYKGRFLPGGGAGNLGIRRSAYDAIGGFDESLPRFADADFYWRLQLEGFELYYLPEAIVQVRIGRVNPRLPYLYRRGRTAAATRCWQYKKYKHLGMLPPPTFRESLGAWLRVLRRGRNFAMRGQEMRIKWIQEFVQQTGDIMGQLQGRITSPCKPYQPGATKQV